MEMSSLQEMEKSEHDLVDLLFRLPMSEVGLRTQASDALTKVRRIKNEFLRRNSDIIRKSSSAAVAPPPRGSPLIEDREVARLVREARDRTAAEHQLSKGVTVYDPARRDSDKGPLNAIRRALQEPYRENAGLVRLLTTRR
jgi:hypothetical protein